MSTVSAILSATADGTLQLSLPVADSLKGFGCLKGKIWMSPDFDEPLEDFQEYM